MKLITAQRATLDAMAIAATLATVPMAMRLASLYNVTWSANALDVVTVAAVTLVMPTLACAFVSIRMSMGR